MQIEADSTQSDPSRDNIKDIKTLSLDLTDSEAEIKEINKSIPENVPIARRVFLSPKITAKMKHHLPRQSTIERTQLNFTKFQTKSGPGEPSRPYYCVRVSKSGRSSEENETVTLEKGKFDYNGLD